MARCNCYKCRMRRGEICDCWECRKKYIRTTIESGDPGAPAPRSRSQRRGETVGKVVGMAIGGGPIVSVALGGVGSLIGKLFDEAQDWRKENPDL